MKDDELLARLRAAFRSEAQERLTTVSTTLLDLERAAEPEQQQPILETVFREAHSLKGAARAVNLNDIETLCQAIENVFGALKKGEIPVSPEIFDTLHESVGVIEEILSTLDADDGAPASVQVAPLIDRFKHLRDEGADTSQTPAEPATQIQAVQAPEATPVPTAVLEAKKEAPAPAAALPKPKAKEEPRPATVQSKPLISETVRIPTVKLDSLFLKAEEMLSLKLIAVQHLNDLRDAGLSFELWSKKQARIDSETRSLRNWTQKEKCFDGKVDNTSVIVNLLEFLEWSREYTQALDRKFRLLVGSEEKNQRRLGRMVDDLLDDMKKVTMLPFSTLFEIFPRMVRDISRAQEKEVDLVIKGGDIEIDRRILEEMKDPVTHLLRNSADHGIEKPEDRVELGKPRRATVSLSVTQVEGDKVEVVVSDDGKGIDLDRVKDKAVEKGVLSRHDADNLDRSAALSLIFRSGVTTSPIITSISGRGLGMAIVQEKIEKLGGNLQIDTAAGEGTTFTIRLPVTIATFRGILIKAAGASFIVPSTNVDRVLRLPRESIKSVENMYTISLNGKVLSLVRLADVLGLDPAGSRKNDADLLSVMVLGTGEKRIAFEIDDVLSEQEVLVKSLGNQLRRIRNIAGATVMGSGEIVPILNIHDLLKSAVRTAGAVQFSAPGEKEQACGEKTVLVTDDSLTSRMLIKSIIESVGYRVITAVDGLDALTTLKTEAIDLVVSDVEMPRMTGLDLTASIRSDARYAETPVVLVTGLESNEDRERGIDVGANAYIVKSSFDQSNLLDAVQRLI